MFTIAGRFFLVIIFVLYLLFLLEEMYISKVRLSQEDSVLTTVYVEDWTEKKVQSWRMDDWSYWEEECLFKADGFNV